MVLFYLFSFAILTHELSLFPTVYFFFKRRVQTILSMIFYRGFAEIIKSIFLIKIILRILSNDQINRRSHDKTTSENHIILKEEVLFVYQTVHTMLWSLKLLKLGSKFAIFWTQIKYFSKYWIRRNYILFSIRNVQWLTRIENAT